MWEIYTHVGLPVAELRGVVLFDALRLVEADGRSAGGFRHARHRRCDGRGGGTTYTQRCKWGHENRNAKNEYIQNKQMMQKMGKRKMLKS